MPTADDFLYPRKIRAEPGTEILMFMWPSGALKYPPPRSEERPTSCSLSSSPAPRPWRLWVPVHNPRLQIAQTRYCLDTLGLKVGIAHPLGVLGKLWKTVPASILTVLTQRLHIPCLFVVWYPLALQTQRPSRPPFPAVLVPGQLTRLPVLLSC